MPVMTRERWKQYSKLTDGLKEAGVGTGARIEFEHEVIRANVNWLIAHLYDPHPEHGRRVSSRAGGFAGESINWGDLSCAEVRGFMDGRWLATIEEASPKECPNLCAWIADWLKQWGWDVQVETEW